MEPGKVLRAFLNIDCVACGFFQQKCTSWWIKNGSLGKENTIKKSQCHLWLLACFGRRESATDTQLHPCALNQGSRQYKNVKITRKTGGNPLTPAAYHPCPLQCLLCGAPLSSLDSCAPEGLVGGDTAVSAVFMSKGVRSWEDGRFECENRNLTQGSPCSGGGPSFLQWWAAQALTASFSFLSPSSCQVRRSS